LSTEIPDTVELPALGPRSEEAPVVIFGSCTHHTLPLFEIRAELADGTSLLLEERYNKPPENVLRDLSAAALTRADVIFPEARLEVADYWNLSYTAQRHNSQIEYWVVLDPAVSVTGVEKPVRVVELIAPFLEEPVVVETARYLGKDFEVLRELEVVSYERIEAQRESFRRGDVNQDGDVNISDTQAIVSYLFARGDTPACQKSADANDNGATTVTDAVEILFYLFRSGDTLPSPFAQCGSDGTDDQLSCETFVPCL